MVTLVALLCMFPQSWVPMKCIAGADLVVETFMFKGERSSSKGDVSAPVVVMQ